MIKHYKKREEFEKLIKEGKAHFVPMNSQGENPHFYILVGEKLYQNAHENLYQLIPNTPETKEKIKQVKNINYRNSLIEKMSRPTRIIKTVRMGLKDKVYADPRNSEIEKDDKRIRIVKTVRKGLKDKVYANPKFCENKKAIEIAKELRNHARIQRLNLILYDKKNEASYVELSDYTD